MTSQPLLATHAVTKRFGGLTAVADVSLAVQPLSIASIIGPNGAGKTTLFNILTGLYRPSSGSVRYQGREISRERPDQILGMGIARTFQNIRLFPTLTARENVLIGRHARLRSTLLGAIVRPPWVRAEESGARERAGELLERVGIRRQLVEDRVTNLSYGDQRRVEIARALASEPSMLLLDEPTAGMNPRESDDLTTLMRSLRDELELFPRLAERRKQAASTMSGGEQQMLAIGRALMARPRLLLLDEPSMGLAPILVERIYQTIAEIAKEGTTILLVEQNANYALNTASRAYVVESGLIALHGDSATVRSSPDVQKAYLGT